MIMVEQMKAITNSTPLKHPLFLKPGHSTGVIRTIGDAALFIVKLPKEHEDRLHWVTAGACLQAADNNPDNSNLINTATISIENALKTEKMLRE